MARQLTVLCIDDEPNVLLSLSAVLRLGGFLTLTATGIKEAVKVLSEHGPVDAVLIDASVCNDADLCVHRELQAVQPSLTAVLHTGDPEVLTQPCVQDKPKVIKPTAPQKIISELKQILADKFRDE